MIRTSRYKIKVGEFKYTYIQYIEYIHTENTGQILVEKTVEKMYTVMFYENNNVNLFCLIVCK